MVKALLAEQFSVDPSGSFSVRCEQNSFSDSHFFFTRLLCRGVHGDNRPPRAFDFQADDVRKPATKSSSSSSSSCVSPFSRFPAL